MFFRLIESIRKKPKETRQLFAFAVSGGITLVIFGVWLVSYTAYVSDKLGGGQGLLSFGSNEVGKAGEVIAEGYSNLKDAKDGLVASSNLASALEADVLSGIVASTSASTTAASSTSTMKPQKASSTATTSAKKLVE